MSMKDLLKKADSILFSGVVVILTCLIFMRYSNDVPLSKQLVQGSLFFYGVLAVVMYLFFKVVDGLMSAAYQYQSKSHHYLNSIFTILLNGSAFFFFYLLFSRNDWASHFDLQTILCVPVLLSAFFISLKDKKIESKATLLPKVGA